MSDPLDKETALSASLTPTGITASAKSRAVAAFDRLCGNVLELVNAPLEKRIGKARAISEGEIKIIKAAALSAADRVKDNPEYADRALEHHFRQIIDKQQRKDAVVLEALEDLRREAPEQPKSDDSERLDDQFMARFERYAEEATTEEIQQRWGRVLAKEIRAPGTFSAKALRVVDELDPPAALLFEKICASRLDGVIPKCLIGDLSFDDVKNLTSAGLLVDPGLTGQLKRPSSYTVNNEESWLYLFENYALAMPKVASISKLHSAVLQKEGDVPMLRVYVLTDVGKSISTILNDDAKNAFMELVKKMQVALPNTTLRCFSRNNAAEDYKFDMTLSVLATGLHSAR